MSRRGGAPFRRFRWLAALGPFLLLAGALLLHPWAGDGPSVGLLAAAALVTGFLICLFTTGFVYRITEAIETLQSHLEGLGSTVGPESAIAVPESPEMAGLASSVQDLAEQLQRLARIESEERRLLETILDAIPSAVVVVGTDRRIRMVNERARVLLGVRRSGVPLGTYLRDLQVIQALDEALQEGRPAGFDITIQDGDFRDLSGMVLPLTAAGEGESAQPLEGAVVTVHDITHIRRLERARRDLIANVSHELKTPVAIVRGFAETLREGALERPEGRDFLRRIEEESRRVGVLVDRLLLLARLEQPAFKPQMGSFDYGALLLRVVGDRKHLADISQIELRLEKPADPVYIRADEDLLRQAVENLLDNALRHTPSGGSVTVRLTEEQDQVLLSVEDTGPGLPAEHRGRVFERFYRVDPARARDSGGTGLGLAIVKHVAQVHGGRADVRSQLGQGATFEIRLPRRLA